MIKVIVNCDHCGKDISDGVDLAYVGEHGEGTPHFTPAEGIKIIQEYSLNIANYFQLPSIPEDGQYENMVIINICRGCKEFIKGGN